MCKKVFRQKNPSVDTAELGYLSPVLSRGERSLHMLAVLFLMPSRRLIITFAPDLLEIIFKVHFSVFNFYSHIVFILTYCIY